MKKIQLVIISMILLGSCEVTGRESFNLEYKTQQILNTLAKYPLKSVGPEGVFSQLNHTSFEFSTSPSTVIVTEREEGVDVSKHRYNVEVVQDMSVSEGTIRLYGGGPLGNKFLGVHAVVGEGGAFVKFSIQDVSDGAIATASAKPFWEYVSEPVMYRIHNRQNKIHEGERFVSLSDEGFLIDDDFNHFTPRINLDAITGEILYTLDWGQVTGTTDTPKQEMKLVGTTVVPLALEVFSIEGHNFPEPSAKFMAVEYHENGTNTLMKIEFGTTYDDAVRKVENSTKYNYIRESHAQRPNTVLKKLENQRIALLNSDKLYDWNGADELVFDTDNMTLRLTTTRFINADGGSIPTGRTNTSLYNVRMLKDIRERAIATDEVYEGIFLLTSPGGVGLYHNKIIGFSVMHIANTDPKYNPNLPTDTDKQIYALFYNSKIDYVDANAAAQIIAAEEALTGAVVNFDNLTYQSLNTARRSYALPNNMVIIGKEWVKLKDSGDGSMTFDAQNTEILSFNVEKPVGGGTIVKDRRITITTIVTGTSSIGFYKLAIVEVVNSTNAVGQLFGYVDPTSETLNTAAAYHGKYVAFDLGSKLYNTQGKYAIADDIASAKSAVRNLRNFNLHEKVNLPSEYKVINTMEGFEPWVALTYQTLDGGALLEPGDVTPWLTTEAIAPAGSYNKNKTYKFEFDTGTVVPRITVSKVIPGTGLVGIATYELTPYTANKNIVFSALYGAYTITRLNGTGENPLPNPDAEVIVVRTGGQGPDGGRGHILFLATADVDRAHTTIDIMANKNLYNYVGEANAPIAPSVLFTINNNTYVRYTRNNAGTTPNVYSGTITPQTTDHITFHSISSTVDVERRYATKASDKLTLKLTMIQDDGDYSGVFVLSSEDASDITVDYNKKIFRLDVQKNGAPVPALNDASGTGEKIYLRVFNEGDDEAAKASIPQVGIFTDIATTSHIIDKKIEAALSQVELPAVLLQLDGDVRYSLLDNNFLDRRKHTRYTIAATGVERKITIDTVVNSEAILTATIGYSIYQIESLGTGYKAVLKLDTPFNGNNFLAINMLGGAIPKVQEYPPTTKYRKPLIVAQGITFNDATTAMGTTTPSAETELVPETLNPVIQGLVIAFLEGLTAEERGFKRMKKNGIIIDTGADETWIFTKDTEGGYIAAVTGTGVAETVAGDGTGRYHMHLESVKSDATSGIESIRFYLSDGVETPDGAYRKWFITFNAKAGETLDTPKKEFNLRASFRYDFITEIGDVVDVDERAFPMKDTVSATATSDAFTSLAIFGPEWVKLDENYDYDKDVPIEKWKFDMDGQTVTVTKGANTAIYTGVYHKKNGNTFTYTLGTGDADAVGYGGKVIAIRQGVKADDKTSTVIELDKDVSYVIPTTTIANFRAKQIAELPFTANIDKLAEQGFQGLVRLEKGIANDMTVSGTYDYDRANTQYWRFKKGATLNVGGSFNHTLQVKNTPSYASPARPVDTGLDATAPNTGEFDVNLTPDASYSIILLENTTETTVQFQVINKTGAVAGVDPNNKFVFIQRGIGTDAGLFRIGMSDTSISVASAEVTKLTGEGVYNWATYERAKAEKHNHLFKDTTSKILLYDKAWTLTRKDAETVITGSSKHAPSTANGYHVTTLDDFTTRPVYKQENNLGISFREGDATTPIQMLVRNVRNEADLDPLVTPTQTYGIKAVDTSITTFIDPDGENETKPRQGIFLIQGNGEYNKHFMYIATAEQDSGAGENDGRRAKLIIDEDINALKAKIRVSESNPGADTYNKDNDLYNFFLTEWLFPPSDFLGQIRNITTGTIPPTTLVTVDTGFTNVPNPSYMLDRRNHIEWIFNTVVVGETPSVSIKEFDNGNSVTDTYSLNSLFDKVVDGSKYDGAFSLTLGTKVRFFGIVFRGNGIGEDLAGATVNTAPYFELKEFDSDINAIAWVNTTIPVEGNATGEKPNTEKHLFVRSQITEDYNLPINLDSQTLLELDKDAIYLGHDTREYQFIPAAGTLIVTTHHTVWSTGNATKTTHTYYYHPVKGATPTSMDVDSKTDRQRAIYLLKGINTGDPLNDKLLALEINREGYNHDSSVDAAATVITDIPDYAYGKFHIYAKTADEDSKIEAIDTIAGINADLTENELSRYTALRRDVVLDDSTETAFETWMTASANQGYGTTALGGGNFNYIPNNTSEYIVDTKNRVAIIVDNTGVNHTNFVRLEMIKKDLQLKDGNISEDNKERLPSTFAFRIRKNTRNDIKFQNKATIIPTATGTTAGAHTITGLDDIKIGHISKGNADEGAYFNKWVISIRYGEGIKTTSSLLGAVSSTSAINNSIANRDGTGGVPDAKLFNRSVLKRPAQTLNALYTDNPTAHAGTEGGWFIPVDILNQVIPYGAGTVDLGIQILNTTSDDLNIHDIAFTKDPTSTVADTIAGGRQYYHSRIISDTEGEESVIRVNRKIKKVNGVAYPSTDNKNNHTYQTDVTNQFIALRRGVLENERRYKISFGVTEDIAKDNLAKLSHWNYLSYKTVMAKKDVLKTLLTNTVPEPDILDSKWIYYSTPATDKPSLPGESARDRFTFSTRGTVPGKEEYLVSRDKGTVSENYSITLLEGTATEGLGQLIGFGEYHGQYIKIKDFATVDGKANQKVRIAIGRTILEANGRMGVIVASTGHNLFRESSLIDDIPILAEMAGKIYHLTRPLKVGTTELFIRDARAHVEYGITKVSILPPVYNISITKRTATSLDVSTYTLDQVDADASTDTRAYFKLLGTGLDKDKHIGINKGATKKSLPHMADGDKKTYYMIAITGQPQNEIFPALLNNSGVLAGTQPGGSVPADLVGLKTFVNNNATRGNVFNRDDLTDNASTLAPLGTMGQIVSLANDVYNPDDNTIITVNSDNNELQVVKAGSVNRYNILIVHTTTHSTSPVVGAILEGVNAASIADTAWHNKLVYFSKEGNDRLILKSSHRGDIRPSGVNNSILGAQMKAQIDLKGSYSYSYWNYQVYKDVVKDNIVLEKLINIGVEREIPNKMVGSLVKVTNFVFFADDRLFKDPLSGESRVGKKPGDRKIANGTAAGGNVGGGYRDERGGVFNPSDTYQLLMVPITGAKPYGQVQIRRIYGAPGTTVTERGTELFNFKILKNIDDKKAVIQLLPVNHAGDSELIKTFANAVLAIDLGPRDLNTDNIKFGYAKPSSYSDLINPANPGGTGGDGGTIPRALKDLESENIGYKKYVPRLVPTYIAYADTGVFDTIANRTKSELLNERWTPNGQRPLTTTEWGGDYKIDNNNHLLFTVTDPNNPLADKKLGSPLPQQTWGSMYGPQYTGSGAASISTGVHASIRIGNFRGYTMTWRSKTEAGIASLGSGNGNNEYGQYGSTVTTFLRPVKTDTSGNTIVFRVHSPDTTIRTIGKIEETATQTSIYDPYHALTAGENEFLGLYKYAKAASADLAESEAMRLTYYNYGTGLASNPARFGLYNWFITSGKSIKQVAFDTADPKPAGITERKWTFSKEGGKYIVNTIETGGGKTSLGAYQLLSKDGFGTGHTKAVFALSGIGSLSGHHIAVKHNENTVVGIVVRKVITAAELDELVNSILVDGSPIKPGDDGDVVPS